MRYRPSVTYFLWIEENCCFELNEFLYFDKYISKTVGLLGLWRGVAFVSGMLDDYVWLDRVI